MAQNSAAATLDVIGEPELTVGYRYLFLGFELTVPMRRWVAKCARRLGVRSGFVVYPAFGLMGEI